MGWATGLATGLATVLAMGGFMATQAPIGAALFLDHLQIFAMASLAGRLLTSLRIPQSPVAELQRQAAEEVARALAGERPRNWVNPW